MTRRTSKETDEECQQALNDRHKIDEKDRVTINSMTGDSSLTGNNVSGTACFQTLRTPNLDELDGTELYSPNKVD